MNERKPIVIASALVSTSAGMCGLWDAERFTSVTDLTQWESLFDSDASIRQLIAEGSFVPLNVGGDGSFQVSVRRRGLTERELQVQSAVSEPYLLVSSGAVRLGGIEQVGSFLGGARELVIAPGSYGVVAHLIDWQADPASVDADGRATQDALADFVVELSELTNELPGGFRRSTMTFEPYRPTV